MKDHYSTIYVCFMVLAMVTPPVLFLLKVMFNCLYTLPLLIFVLRYNVVQDAHLSGEVFVMPIK